MRENVSIGHDCSKSLVSENKFKTEYNLCKCDMITEALGSKYVE